MTTVQSYPQMASVQVVSCSDLKRTQSAQKPTDPYVVLKYSEQKFTTKTDEGGGKNPSFNDTFKFNVIKGLEEMRADVYENNFDGQKEDGRTWIGGTRISLSRMIETGHDEAEWLLAGADQRCRILKICKKSSGKSSGRLKLILQYDGARNKQVEISTQSGSTSYGPPYGPVVPTYGAPHFVPVYEAPPPIAYVPATTSSVPYFPHPSPSRPPYSDSAFGVPRTYFPEGYIPAGYTPVWYPYNNKD